MQALGLVILFISSTEGSLMVKDAKQWCIKCPSVGIWGERNNGHFIRNFIIQIPKIGAKLLQKDKEHTPVDKSLNYLRIMNFEVYIWD